mmetsp:Transcript_20380/g.43842  ORF Transcript_20380/g.43842 Transcript_20380/m.43842 type:complete len:236 (+) Transcript_20380:9-716(+)
MQQHQEICHLACNLELKHKKRLTAAFYPGLFCDGFLSLPFFLVAFFFFLSSPDDSFSGFNRASPSFKRAYKWSTEATIRNSFMDFTSCTKIIVSASLTLAVGWSFTDFPPIVSRISKLTDIIFWSLESSKSVARWAASTSTSLSTRYVLGHSENQPSFSRVANFSCSCPRTNSLIHDKNLKSIFFVCRNKNKDVLPSASRHCHFFSVGTTSGTTYVAFNSTLNSILCCFVNQMPR